MSNRFNDVLEAVEHLSLDEQADLVDVIQRRLAEQGRQRVINDVKEARADLQSEKAKPSTVDDIMREIES